MWHKWRQFVQEQGALRAVLCLTPMLLAVGVGGASAVLHTWVPAVSVVHPSRGPARDAVYANGHVEVASRVALRARWAGTVMECLVTEGQQVRKGTVLARLDNPVARYNLGGSRAELGAAKRRAQLQSPELSQLKAAAEALVAEREVVHTDLERVRALVHAGSIAQAELDRAQARLAHIDSQIQANRFHQEALRSEFDTHVERLQATTESLAVQVEDGEIKAPWDGTVLRKFVEPGQGIASGDVLFEVGDAEHLVVDVSVEESDVARVKKDASVWMNFRGLSGKAFRGAVDRVQPEADRTLHSYRVRIRPEQLPPELRPGLSVDAQIVVRDEPRALLVPSQVLRGSKLWTVRDRHVEERVLKLGVQDKDWSEVLEGLGENDWVVVEGAERVGQGQRVRAFPAPSERVKPKDDGPSSAPPGERPSSQGS